MVAKFVIWVALQPRRVFINSNLFGGAGGMDRETRYSYQLMVVSSSQAV